MTTHYTTWTAPTTVTLLAGTTARVMLMTRDDSGALERAHVTVTDRLGKVFGPFDVYFGDLDDLSADEVVDEVTMAVRCSRVGSIGLTRDEVGTIALDVITIAGLVCPGCSETYDRGCDGERRCPTCDEPCAGCHDGGA